MKQERSPTRGGINSCEMGLGKTLQMLAHCVMEANFAQAKEEVDKEWSAGTPSKHLAKHTENNPQPKEARCPSKTRFGLRCPCEKWGPTYDWKASLGATLIFVPAGLVLTFRNEFIKFIDKDFSHPMKLHIELGENRIPNVVQNQLAETMTTEIKDLPDGSQKVKWFLGLGKVEHSRHILVTSYNTWQSRLSERWFDNHSVEYKNSKGEMVTANCKYLKVNLARFIIDEVHTTKGKDTIAMKLMNKLNYASRWVYSGTAVEGQPKRAIGAFLDALRDPQWKTHAALRYAMDDEWEKLNGRYNLFIKPERSDKLGKQEFDKELHELVTGMSTLWPALMIKMVQTTPWGRTEITPDLPSTQHKDIMVRLPPDVAKAINERQSGIFRDLAEKGIRNMGNRGIEKVFFQYCMSVRVLTTYPALNDFVKKGLITGFLGGDFNKWGWPKLEVVRKSPLYQHRGFLQKNSPKYLALFNAQQKFPLNPLSSGYPQPHLVLSCSPSVAAITWMVIFSFLSLSFPPLFDFLSLFFFKP